MIACGPWRRAFLPALVVAAICACGVEPAEAGESPGRLSLWYPQAASNWMKEALPIGNGRLGGMIFGGIDEEHIQFNVDSLWTGDDKDTGAYQNFGDLFIGGGVKGDAAAAPGGPGVAAGSPHKAYYAHEGIQASVDGNVKTKWCVEHRNKPVVWVLRAPKGEGVAHSSYTFTSGGDSPPRDPRSWVLEASADGRTWVELDKQENVDSFRRRSQERTFSFENSTKYEAYRFRFLKVNGGSRLQIAEIRLGAKVWAPSADKAPGAPSAGSTGYRRELDITRAVHRITYTRGGVKYRREYFCSNPHEVMVLRFTADRPGAHSLGIRLKDAHNAKASASGSSIVASGKLSNGLQYGAHVRVVHEGGKCVAEGGALNLTDVDSFTVLVAADTNYLADYSKGWRGPDPLPRIEAQTEAAARMSYDKLLAAHVEDHRKLFGRVSLDLGRTDDDALALSTEHRLARYNKERAADPDLEELFFQFGRYLLVASSRDNGLPANLQGLWNHSNRPPWRSDYHSNINIQMNYWPAEPTNLSECHRVFADYVSSLREIRKVRTREHYPNVRGWTVRTENNIYGGSGWKWNPPGSAWYAQHLWEHYAFGRDSDYLRRITYPVLKEVCEFWEDRLKKRPDGTLVVPDGWSPEHGPTEEGVSYDQQLVYDLFTNYIEAAGELGVDRAYRDRVSAMREALLGPKIGQWGQLQEWETDRDSQKNKHRQAPPRVAPVRAAPRQADHPADAEALRGGQGLSDRARRRRHRLVARVEDQLLGEAPRRRSRVRDGAQPPHAGRQHSHRLRQGRRRRVPESLRRPPTVPDRRQLRRDGGCRRDAAAVTSALGGRRLHSPSAARAALGVADGARAGAARARRVRGRHRVEGRQADGGRPQEHRRHSLLSALWG